MNNSKLNKAFLLSLDTKTANTIVLNIANHYGISNDEVFDEIYDDESESIMDYITGNIRMSVYRLFEDFKRK